MLENLDPKLPEEQPSSDSKITDVSSKEFEQEVVKETAEKEVVEDAVKSEEELTEKTGAVGKIVEKTEEAVKESTEKLPSKETLDQNLDKGEVESEIEVVSEEINEEVAEPTQKKKAIEAEAEKEAGTENNDKGNSEKVERQEPQDFSSLRIEDLLVEFENILYRSPINEVKKYYFDFKKAFDTKFKALIEEEKAKFIEGGGDEIDFYFTSPFKSKFNSLVNSFKKKRQEAYLALEAEQKENLVKKTELIERLKDLIDNAEPASMYKDFKDLQTEWRNIGQIPKANYNDIWQTYQHHVERFYDLLHLSNEFKDLDFKHNFEEKSKLVERAEALSEYKDIDKAFRELQVLHRLWKEEIGPVAREYREEIWHKFSEATKKIHEKRHEFQKVIDEQLEKNVDLKFEVIKRIEQIDFSKLESRQSWQEAIKKVEALRKEFLDIGRVTKARNEEVWSAFKNATRNFNKEKNKYFKSVKGEQLDNLRKKMLLIEQAESLKDSEDWKTVTDIFKKIQADWKKIGHVPRKDSDRIWKRFKAACNHFFDRLHQRQDGINTEQSEIIDQKKELLGHFKEEIKQEENIDLDAVNTFVEEWRNLGEVPGNMGHLNTKFNKTLDSAYKKLDLDEDESSFLKFKNIVDSYAAQNDGRKLESEHHFVRKKCDELTREIKQLENNVSFISNASQDNPLIQNVLNNIENYKNELKVWQRKLKYLNALDY
ncbi:MAG: DUF349 domain-containing protein [Lutimonas sp.]